MSVVHTSHLRIEKHEGPHRPHRELPGADPLQLARHTGSSVGEVEVTAPTQEEALTKIERCPCRGASGNTVGLQVREEEGKL
jgi:hypothetical protein